MIDLKEIIQYIKNHTFHYKTHKSIYNILIGAKTHQTYFDGCSQQLLSLYHSQPDLKYTSFERIFDEIETSDTKIPLKISTRYTFDSIQNTFQVLQLLIQTISFKHHHTLEFIPVSQVSKVQDRAKSLFYKIQHQTLDVQFKNEVYLLFDLLNQTQTQSVLHYFLQGYDEIMYTNQQVSLIEDINMSDLAIIKMNDLVEMMHLLEDTSTFPLLSQMIILPSLSLNTKDTFKLVQSGLTFDEIAQKEGVKVNTIEDHILELYIKGYLSDYDAYLKEDQFQAFQSFFKQHSNERLRTFKAEFPKMSYFEIKLAIVLIARREKTC
ncbi:helix-turn-helix domain-containing protein [Staphylococcus simulans]